MIREFTLPDVGEGLTEAEIVSWLVEIGDTVSEDQPVAEVETDKAVVEVPSPVDGTVREIRAEEGEMVPVGEVIITFDTDEETSPGSRPSVDDVESEPMAAGEPAEPDDDGVESAVSVVDDASDAGDASDADGESGTATKGGRTFAAPSARRLARELDVDIDAVEGSGPGGRVTGQDVRGHAEHADDEDGAGAETPEGAEPAVKSATRTVTETADESAEATETARTEAPSVESADRDRTLAAPATRTLAEEEGVDIDAVPTDETRDGEAFVSPEQVRAYAKAQRAAQAADAAAVSEAGADAESATVGGAGTASADVTTDDRDDRVERRPYRGIRRTIGEAMERSKYTAPHVTHHEQIVVDDLVATRERLTPTAEERGSRLTYTPFVVKAVVEALKQHPILNSRLDEENDEIRIIHDYNIGIAVATEAGLMVPVIEDADTKGLLEIADEVNELAREARDRSIAREEMQGGTFSITNFGAIGGEYATPIINYPETAILGLGELEQRPVAERGEVVAKHTLPLSLSIDHRVIDGADAARFVDTLAEYVENPELLLL